ncbi:MAG: conjugal transfer protein TraH, partial [Sutterellaceae bacterium]|nr:conjugal transfer protein TraH [Sutterellaceae bacterium]
MRTKKISFIAAATSVALAFGSLPFAQAGDLQSKMDAVFNDMSNFSRPGVFETQRRGVLSGGSFYSRSPIMNTELVNLQLPSAKAGCGGIDLFGGSFSFINADQFVQLLRSIASNAKGYAFNIALGIACEDCMAWINNLQSKIQRLNEKMGNSCELAQGLVSDVAKAFDKEREYEYSLVGTVTGLYDDFFGSKESSSGTDKKKEIDEKKPEEAKRIVGNIVWESLKDGKVANWISGADNEKKEYGILMAVSGTIVIPKSTEDAKNPDKGNTTNPRYYPALIEFKDLLDGGTVKLYTCPDDDCLDPGTDSINIVGMVKRVREALIGADGNSGIVLKFSQTTNNSFTAKESNLMSNMPAALGTVVRNLSTASYATAKEEASDWAYAIAMSWAYDLIMEQLRATRQAISNNTKSEVVKMR